MPLLALDVEATGVDHYHGARTFLVTVCNEQQENTHWEWAVNPLTREPIIFDDDKEAIRSLIMDENIELVLHNARFDCSAINTIIPLSQENDDGTVEDGYWPWHRTEDTLVAAHVLGSALPHGLDDCAAQYLRFRMNAYEDRMEIACKAARDYARRYLPEWRIAREGDPMMPSFKGSKKGDKNGQDKDKGWKMDMWLLKAITSYTDHSEAQQKKIDKWRLEWAPEVNGTVITNNGKGDGLCADYANLDSAVTQRLWPVLKQHLHRRGLWEIYKERMKLLPIAYKMERNGLTISEDRLHELVRKYSKGVSDANETCLRIARELNYPLTMPAGSANNQSLKTFFFGEATVSCANCHKRVVAGSREDARSYKGKTGPCRFCKKQTTAVVREWPWLNLPVLKRTETNQPSLDKETMTMYLGAEELTPVQREFLTSLRESRKQAKATEALLGYQTFWLPHHTDIGTMRFPTRGWKLLHPNLNQTGTDTLRWSCKNPNLQNPSKDDDYGVREPFGPAPGRETWRFDYRNIEKRIPAYECGEPTFIDLFERANEPPFFGSDHILKFSAVYPHLWEKALREHGPDHAAEWIKSPEGYKATYYQWIKNTNFALQYECGDAKADATAHAKGVKKLLSGAFPLEAAMKKYWIAFANRNGYVETMPRKSVNPNKGYPLMTKRTEKFGRTQVSPTLPLAYHVSGTAMDLTAAAMIKCQAQLDVWNREVMLKGGPPNQYRMPLQVHDELFFDWPKAEDPKKNPRRSNLGRARVIQRLMESCGDDIICRRVATDGKVVKLPTPVSVDYHPVSWDVGVAI